MDDRQGPECASTLPVPAAPPPAPPRLGHCASRVSERCARVEVLCGASSSAFRIRRPPRRGDRLRRAQPEVVIGRCAQRVLFQRAPIERDRLVETTKVQQPAHRRPAQHPRIARRQLQRPAKGCLRTAPVPVVNHLDPAQPRVPLRQIRLQRERTRHRLPRPPKALATGAQPLSASARVRPPQLRPRERELRIQRQRLLQIPDSLRRVLAGKAIDEVPPL